MSILETFYSNFKKRLAQVFNVGDKVEVIAGPDQGEAGIILGSAMIGGFLNYDVKFTAIFSGYYPANNLKLVVPTETLKSVPTRSPKPAYDKLVEVLYDLQPDFGQSKITLPEALGKIEKIGITYNIPELASVTAYTTYKELYDLKKKLAQELGLRRAQKQFKFEVLRTTLEKAQGLQHRTSLDSDTILIFDSIPVGSTFHSSNCLFKFDLAFLDKSNRILKAKTITPQEETCSAPEGTVRAIEANANFLKNNGYFIGDIFEGLDE